MYYPIIGERVRVSGRRDEHVVVSTDYTACAAEISPQADGTASKESVPFSLLLETTASEVAQNKSHAIASRVDASYQVLHSSREHIDRGRFLITDSRNLMFKTGEVIRASQQLIHRSDLVIARAQTLDCT